MLNSALISVQHLITQFKTAHIQEHVLHLYDQTTVYSAASSRTTFKIAHIQEHELPLYDLTMLNSASFY